MLKNNHWYYGIEEDNWGPGWRDWRPYCDPLLSLWQVIAIDHSGRLLDAAMKIQQGKSLEIKGARDLPFVNIPLDEIKANVDRVQFQQVCLMVVFKMVCYAAIFVSSRKTSEEPCVTT